MIISKEIMRSKYGMKSPDDADSFNMAYHATSMLNKKIEDNEDFKTPIQHKDATNLFKLAGFR